MIEFLGIVVGFGLLVIWHELGHFLAALSVGIKPSVFSVGFGRKIWGVNIKGVDFRISALPLGGYVKFEDESAAGIPSGFFKKPLWARLWIVAAGPLFSFILGPILAFFLSAYRGSVSLYTTTIYNSKTEKFQRGDSIIEVNDKKVNSGEELLSILSQKSGKRVHFIRKRISNPIVTYIEGDYSDSVELRILPRVGSTLKDFPAHGKLRSGDWIYKVDSVYVYSWQQLVEYVQEKKEGNTITLGIIRDGKRMEIRLPVKVQDGKGKIGVFVAYREKRFASLPEILENTWFFTKRFSLLIFEGIYKLLSGNVKVQESVGGPLTIGIAMAEAANSGFDIWLSFLILITINLAIINLLPIPGLDGGHLLFLTIDEIYYRIFNKRIPERAMMWILMAGIITIIALAIFVITLDIHRLITGDIWKMLRQP